MCVCKPFLVNNLCLYSDKDFVLYRPCSRVGHDKPCPLNTKVRSQETCTYVCFVDQQGTCFILTFAGAASLLNCMFLCLAYQENPPFIMKKIYIITYNLLGFVYSLVLPYLLCCYSMHLLKKCMSRPTSLSWLTPEYGLWELGLTFAQERWSLYMT